MKRFALLLSFLLALPAVAETGFTASSSTTVRLGSKVISAGDSEKKVLEAGGSPVRRVDLVNGFGVKLGERWTYQTGNSRYTIIEFRNDGTVYGVRDVIGQ
jgi:hypothetical protein